MKASLSTINDLGGRDKDISSVGVDKLVGLATNRLGGLEGFEEYGNRYNGIYVARVMSCVPHDNSDHLHVCMVDDGGVVEGVERDSSGNVQVVCGAPNVREGLIVAWIPPGATVPKSFDDKEQFILSVREIRGKISNGMLASESELGLSDNHDGILEINVKEVGEDLVKPGTEFKKLYGLDDLILDFENKMFTHRPDCFGQMGLARELTAITGDTFTSPEWYWKKPKLESKDAQEVNIFNEAESVVPRFMAVAMSDVKIGQSPVWLKSFITKMGGKPVNNVVDISNYIMHITGQPTHAYDLKKLDGVTIGARMAKKGEKINLLNGKTASLSLEDIVIVDGKGPVGIAGIMGSADSEVDETTTDILLEVASFDMYTIRKSAMRHGLFTDAFTRFSKGQSPLQNDRVIAKFMELLGQITGAKQSSVVHDLTSDSTEEMLDRHMVHDLLTTSVDFINSRLGTALNYEEIRKILKSVEMAVIPGEDGVFEVGAPYWRTDIELPEDIVEEVGRLYGFDRLELKLPQRSTKPAPRNELNDFKTGLRNKLSSAGANEVLSYSFVHGDTLKITGINDIDKWCFHLRNAVSPDLQYYRPNLIVSLLTKAQPNLRSDLIRSDDNEFAIYEIGKAHVKGHNDDEGLPAEYERLAMIYAADAKTAESKYSGSAYYQAKYCMEAVIGTKNVEYKPLETNDYPICSAYEMKRSSMVYVDGELLGVVGEFRPEVKRKLKLPDFCAGFELDIGLLKSKLIPEQYKQIGSFPKVHADITLAVSSDATYSELNKLIEECLGKLVSEKGYQSSFRARDIFQKNDEKINYTYRIWFWHDAKTLRTEEINAAMDKITKEAKDKLSAERV